jgi:hypothetical protein
MQSKTERGIERGKNRDRKVFFFKRDQKKQTILFKRALVTTKISPRINNPGSYHYNKRSINLVILIRAFQTVHEATTG